MVIVHCCWKRWWTRRVFAAPATVLPTGSMSDKPPDAVVWTGSTKLTVKPSKTSTFIRWSPTPGSGYAAISRGKQIRPKEVNLQVEVGVYNHSAVPARMLARAEHEAGRIFERAGVATIWLHCPVTAQEALHNRACAPDRNPRLM